MVEAIDRPDIDAINPVILQHVERNVGASAALRPELAIEIGEILGLLALDANDHIAPLDAGLLGRTAWADPADEEPPVQLVGIDSKPRPSGSGPVPVRDEIA